MEPKFVLILIVLILLIMPTFGQALRIGYQPSIHHIAEMVAYEKGWWAEDLLPYGVTEIREFEFYTGSPEMQAMVEGKLDVAYLGIVPIINGINKGLDAKIVACVNAQGSSLVLRPDLGYGGPESIMGHSIGTSAPGSLQDIILKKWLMENDVNVSKIDIKAMDPGDATSALSAGQIDGVFLPQPFPSKIELDKKGITVVQSGEMWADHACCSLLVSGKLLREQPDLVDQIIKTHIKATKYINANQKEAAEIYAKRTKQDVAVVNASIESWDGKWVSDPNIQISSTKEYAAYLYENKFISTIPDINDLFDLGFYQDIMNKSL